MNRNKALCSIRKTLNLPLDFTENSVLINFQNQAIRPVFKFQNDFLVELFKSYIDARKMEWNTSDRLTKVKYITAAISNDKHLKATIIGSIIGLLTNKELSIYFENQREVNRRISAMAKERLLDQLV